MTISGERVYDARCAYARVSGEEPLRTPRGGRPIDIFEISLEWRRGSVEPALRAVGLPLFNRKPSQGSDYVTRNFALSDYAAVGATLPQWIKDFCARWNPNPGPWSPEPLDVARQRALDMGRAHVGKVWA